jgi:hypothetical protein
VHAFYFLQLSLEISVLLTVESGGEVFGRERHGKRRRVAEKRLVVHVLEERRFDDELLAVRACGHLDVIVQARGDFAIDFAALQQSEGGKYDDSYSLLAAPSSYYLQSGKKEIYL